MGVEVRPLNVLCNIQCLYCYQHPQRDTKQVSQEYDLVRIKQAIDEERSPFTLFGGEPLLMPFADLEDLWAWGLERFGQNGIQTNGTLITEAHIALFKKYKVRVGLSLDGPGELNDIRWHGSLSATRSSTAKAEHAIRRLCEEDLHPALIITLHKANATAPLLPVLIAWVDSLIKMGIRTFRVHLLESESDTLRDALALSNQENINALLAFRDLAKTTPATSFDLFKDMRALLLGEDHSVSCIWSACDPYTTAAVRGIEGQGQRSNCGRTNKDGIDFGKGSRPGYERYVALAETPQDQDGCQGCRFFAMCKGQCPGTAVDGDWRNRSEHCEVWKAVFTDLETELVGSGLSPLSLDPRREEIERQLVSCWREGRHSSIATILGDLVTS